MGLSATLHQQTIGSLLIISCNVILMLSINANIHTSYWSEKTIYPMQFC